MNNEIVDEFAAGVHDEDEFSIENMVEGKVETEVNVAGRVMFLIFTVAVLIGLVCTTLITGISTPI